MRMRILVSLTATLALFACGDDEESEPETVEDPATIQQGKSVGQQSTTLTSVPEGTDESAGQVAFSQVGNSMQALVGQYQSVKAQSAQGQQGSIPGQLRQAQVADDGGFNFADGKLEANVTYDSPNGAISYIVDLTISDVDGGKSIDGDFDFAYSGTSGGYDIEYAYDATYDGVKITENCAAGGTITVKYNLSVSGDAFNNLPAEARAQIADGVGGDGTITVTFGPTCDDVVVAGT